MSDTFTPVKDRVLLKRVDGKSKTDSGFVIPDAAKEKPTECEVIAISTGYVSEYCGMMILPPAIPGDRVMIGKYSGSAEIKLNGVEHIVVRWDEILGVLRKLPEAGSKIEYDPSKGIPRV